MAGGENGKKEELRGFAGISSLVSDVDVTPPPVTEEKLAAAPSAPRPALQPSSGLSVGKWVLGIAAVIGVFWLIGQADKPTTSSAPSYSPPPQSAAPSYSPPVQSTTPSSPSAQPQAPSRPTESKPQVGQNLVLSREEIRYCLAEDIRMNGAKSALNNYIDADVDRFNAMVADYNSRCSSFQYQTNNRGRNDLKSAQRDIEPFRSQIQSEGRSRFARSTPTGELPPQPPSRPASDATVRAIQHKLNELGYKAGAVDGLVGRGTRSAIIAFQQDRGLAATGVADQALLLQLQQEPVRTSTPSVDRRPDSASVQLSAAETASLEAACSTDKYVNGPAAYRACVDRQKAALAAGVRRPNLSSLSSAEQQSIEAACSVDKYVNGPAAYNKCLKTQLEALDQQGGRPDLSGLSTADRRSMESACSMDKYVNGPAAYNRCLSQQLARLR